jgi:predicted secreted hydrolase
MDHQWGNFVSLAGAGWDWYSMQLSNNTEYMLYVIRDSQHRPLSTVPTMRFIHCTGADEWVP